MTRHRHECPECGATVETSAKHHARQRARCKACVRQANGWTCGVCASADPHHPFPCPASAAELRTADGPSW